MLRIKIFRPGKEMKWLKIVKTFKILIKYLLNDANFKLVNNFSYPIFKR